LSSLPVFFGVLGAQFGFRPLDPLAALFVGILVGKIGFELLSKNLHNLMDVPLQSKEIKRIKELVAIQRLVHMDRRYQKVNAARNLAGQLKALLYR